MKFHVVGGIKKCNPVVIDPAYSVISVFTSSHVTYSTTTRLTNKKVIYYISVKYI